MQHALTHPVHFWFAFTIAVSASLTWVACLALEWMSISLLDVGFAVGAIVSLEVITFTALAAGIWIGVPALRRSLNAALVRAERQRAAAHRERLLGRMSPAHRQQLFELERAVDAIARVGGPPTQDIVDGCYALLAAYVRAAIEHKAACTLLTDGAALDEDLSHLQSVGASESTAACPWIEPRLAIARRRAAAWHRACAVVGEREDQLALIAQRVRLAREDAVASRTTPDAETRLRVELVDEGIATAQEPTLIDRLAEEDVLEEEVEVDARMLALGRSAGADVNRG